MVAFAVPVVLFVAGWLIHLAWWRIALPRRHTLALLGVFLVAVPAIAAIAWAALGRPALLSPAEFPAVLALYAGAVMCYLITYAGVEHTSPSLVIVRALEAAGPDGCRYEDLLGLITEESFVRPRLSALKRDGLLMTTEEGTVLTARGRRAARVAAAIGRLFDIREAS